MHQNNSYPSLSFWEKKSFLSNWDITIIGSGIVGLSAAIKIKELNPHLNVLILERGIMPMGASTRNAGFACFGSMTELLEDIETSGEETTLNTVQMRWEGLQKLKERIGEDGLDFNDKCGYEIFTDDNVAKHSECVDKMDYLNDLLKPIIGTKRVFKNEKKKIHGFGFSEKVVQLVHNAYEGTLDTGKMMRKLLHIAQEKGVMIINNVKVTEIFDSNENVKIHTDHRWEILTEKALLCTNGFTRSLFPNIEVEPARNQVFITNPIPDLKLKGAFHYDRGYYYFRNVGNRILMGGGRNIAPQIEQTDELNNTSLIQNNLIQFYQEIFNSNTAPDIDCWWSGILGIGSVKKPIVELYSKNIGVAVRLSGMGVAIGSLVGEAGAMMILNENE
ncbi:MAG: FAD-binding oxidoreductase [Saprospiraceae bacterium]|nr:FAD-binding oxidoreductase [Saprospiraceae bacterium]